MTKELVHSLLLVVCIALAFVFPQTGLAAYDIEIAAFLFVLLFIVRRLSLFSRRTRLFESAVFTLIILGVVNSTGGLQSPCFFLVHFLLFSIALLLEPIIPIIVTEVAKECLSPHSFLCHIPFFAKRHAIIFDQKFDRFHVGLLVWELEDRRSERPEYNDSSDC